MKKIDVTGLQINPFELINKDWLLISVGTPEKWNTMTASWGALGVIWGKPTATIYVRHSRYTHELIDQNEFFTLTFLKDGHRDALNLLGSKSGRDIDKMHDSGLTSVFVDGQPAFEEAKLTLVCKKRGRSEIEKTDILQEETITKCYADNDFHTMYLGEIVAAYEN